MKLLGGGWWLEKFWSKSNFIQLQLHMDCVNVFLQTDSSSKQYATEFTFNCHLCGLHDLC